MTPKSDQTNGGKDNLTDQTLLQEVLDAFALLNLACGDSHNGEPCGGCGGCFAQVVQRRVADRLGVLGTA